MKTVSKPVAVKQIKTKKESKVCLTERINPDTSGENVRIIQKFLLQQGYAIPQDGFYGSDTFLAVKAFQEKYRSEILKPQGFARGTGIWGYNTAKTASFMGLCDIK